jgi:hypothetical protein
MGRAVFWPESADFPFSCVAIVYFKKQLGVAFWIYGVFRRGNIWKDRRKAELLSRIEYQEIPSVIEQTGSEKGVCTQ